MIVIFFFTVFIIVAAAIVDITIGHKAAGIPISYEGQNIVSNIASSFRM
jgi:hypothetical protein